jgi:hypothetical protein
VFVSATSGQATVSGRVESSFSSVNGKVEARGLSEEMAFLRDMKIPGVYVDGFGEEGEREEEEEEEEEDQQAEGQGTDDGRRATRAGMEEQRRSARANN